LLADSQNIYNLEAKMEEAKTTEEKKEAKNTTQHNGKLTRIVKIPFTANWKNLLIICLFLVSIALLAVVYSIKSGNPIPGFTKQDKAELQRMFHEQNTKFETLLIAVKANCEGIKELNSAIDRLHPLDEKEKDNE
jgi:hypothetical protein